MIAASLLNSVPFQSGAPFLKKKRVIDYNRRIYLILLVMLAALVGIMGLPPLAQNPMYHVFADRRGLLGIPNFLNVVTNVMTCGYMYWCSFFLCSCFQ